VFPMSTLFPVRLIALVDWTCRLYDIDGMRWWWRRAWHRQLIAHDINAECFCDRSITSFERSEIP
jgi:hypothetical protein